MLLFHPNTAHGGRPAGRRGRVQWQALYCAGGRRRQAVAPHAPRRQQRPARVCAVCARARHRTRPPIICPSPIAPAARGARAQCASSSSDGRVRKFLQCRQAPEEFGFWKNSLPSMLIRTRNLWLAKIKISKLLRPMKIVWSI